MDFRPIANIVLVTPEIPQNTGNVIRLCANVGAQLHLVKPLGFELENRGLRRASLDYSDLTNISVHNSVDELFEGVSMDRVYGATIPGDVLYTTPRYEQGDTIVFGPESVGLPDMFVNRLNNMNRIQIPMVSGNRSLNISNAAAIIVYEVWRQIGFIGASDTVGENQLHFT